MKKFIIIDDALDEKSISELKKFKHSTDVTWFDINQSTVYNPIINICKEYFDLSESTGYEVWRNVNPPGLHIDKNEELYEKYNVVKQPLCSVTYYLSIDYLENGEFYTDNLLLTPVSNRLVIFSPEIYHGVNNYMGKRYAISINPWKENPELMLKKYGTVP